MEVHRYCGNNKDMKKLSLHVAKYVPDLVSKDNQTNTRLFIDNN